MNGTFVSTLLFLTLVCGGSAAWGSEAGKILERRKHQQWESFVLTQERAASFTARMTTQETSYGERSVLLVDFRPEQCGVGIPQIIVCGAGPGVRDTVRPGRGQIRVDTRDVYEADITLAKNDDCVFVTFEKIYGGDILNDAIRGNTIRFKIESQGSEAVYKKYSLVGFTEAYNRATSMCAQIRSLLNRSNDSDYFDGESPRPAPQPRRPSEKPDKEFFL